MTTKNKKNKKGFTLVELLAVIVVLALILILTVPAVLKAMDNSKKKVFQMFGERMINLAMQTYESDKLLGTGSGKITSDNKMCYTRLDLGIKDDTYQGYVIVYPSTLSGENATRYEIVLTDATFYYNKATSVEVLGNDVNKIKRLETNAELEAAKTHAAACTEKTGS